jgi:hypothetical protein
MKQITVKIERRLLHLAETQTQGRRIAVKSARSFPLPEHLTGDASADDPAALARFIADSIERGRLPAAPAALMFHSGIVPYHEYYHRKMSSFEERRRARTEAESFFPPDFGRYIFENECYNVGEDSDNQASAIFAVKDGFLRPLIASLKSHGVKSCFASSTLSVWSDLMRNLLSALVKNNVHLGVNPLCLDICEDCVRFLFFVQTRLVHRCELQLPEEVSDEELLSFIEEKTREIVLQIENREEDADVKPDCVLFAGTHGNAPNFADRIAGRLNTPCRNFGLYTNQLRAMTVFGGELAEKYEFYDRLVSRIGVVPRKQRELNLRYGGFRKRRERVVVRAVAVCLALATIAAMSVLPLMNWRVEQENAEDLEIITRQIYAEAREKLAEERQLNALLQSQIVEDAYMRGQNLRYGALLYQISRSLFARSRIERVAHESGRNSMSVTFTTSDPEYFIESKEKMNKDGNLTVEEPITMNRVDKTLWRCVVTLSWNNTPAMGGTNE